MEGAEIRGARKRVDDADINQGHHIVSNFCENDSQDNSLATATVAAVGGQSHYLTAIIASYSAANIGTLTVKDGATTLFTVDVHNSLVIPFPKGLEITEGNALSAELEASGSGGQIGTVTLIGNTAP